MRITKQTLVSLSIMIFSTTLYAAQYADLTKKENKKKSEPIFAAVAPGTRVLSGDPDQNEFYVLGKNEPDPVKPKLQTAKADNEKNNGKKVDVTKVEVNKAHVYKVEINKTVVRKPEMDKQYIASSPDTKQVGEHTEVN